ncbi:uncharacterized protein LOC110455318 [Mizuhopecten yessoensis]|uniref:Uncharacterized protein n=1 Tax=Mizuhopecten yessoensis TaxID=6573 RepID=A0A210QDC9_MIZYE|nr:uncharacterized protein LOC110455318 [Mizuhopecten yessoensis]XP_021361069.1 uncharacterized protein LOC110455318 [Mizuhopecten yessoensis]OWF46740.1 hypothetical protein KP79_PYT21236 [Mizuhopecten yessoensis]
MWLKVVQQVTLTWVVLASTAGFQMYPNNQARVPYYNNDVYNQRPTYRQAMAPRLVQPQSFSINRTPNQMNAYRPAQRPTNRQGGGQKSPAQPGPVKSKKRTKTPKPRISRRQRQYHAMMARRRLAEMHYRFRMQTCDAKMSLFCRCSRVDCPETEVQVFACGYMWTGMRCCKRWWAMRCLMSELMAGQGDQNGGTQGQGRMSLQTAMMAPMLMEALEM